MLASLIDFVLHIDVSVERIRQGHEMGAEDLPSLPTAPQDEALSRAVVVAMEAQYGLRFSAGECRYVLLLLMSRRVLSWKQASMAAADIYGVVTEMLVAVRRTFCYDFSHDFELIASLSTHLIPLRTRLLFGMQQENPVGREIREGGPLAYEMAVRSLPMRPAISRCIFMSPLSACMHSAENASSSSAVREKGRQCCSPTPSKRITENILR